MKKLLVKIIINCLFAIPMLMYFTNASLFQISMTAVSLSILAFFIGDQWILYEYGNAIATIADFFVCAFFLGAIALGYNWDLSLTELVIVSAILAAVEYGYHLLLGKWDVKWYS